MAAIALPAASGSSSCAKYLRLLHISSSRSSLNFSNCRLAGLKLASVSTMSPSSCRGLKRRVTRSMAETKATPLDVCVKASTSYPDRLGDCPFTQRVLLTLEEKHIPYNTKLVDLNKKPDWLFEVSPEGKVPVIKLDEKWIPDSDIITKLLEEKYPNPPLETPPDKALAGSKIFPGFIKFLVSPTDSTEQTLLEELRAFNEHLKANGPYINGKNICAADLSLAPKLFHMEIALGHLRSWSVPEELTYVHSYMKALFDRESFAKTKAFEEDVIAGWRKKVNG